MKSVLRMQVAFVGISICLGPCFAADTPSRGDSVASGDRIELTSDAPIFSFDPRIGHASADSNGNTQKACAPTGSLLVITAGPAQKTTTTPNPPDAGTKSKTTEANGETTTVTTVAKAGQQVTMATAKVVRNGPHPPLKQTWPLSFFSQTPEVQDKEAQIPGLLCKFQFTKQLDNVVGVQENTVYEFSTGDLKNYSNVRYGWTYGAIVVPTKLIIADRSFSSSTSVLPYVGYEGWAGGASGAFVVAAGNCSVV